MLPKMLRNRKVRVVPDTAGSRSVRYPRVTFVLVMTSWVMDAGSRCGQTTRVLLTAMSAPLSMSEVAAACHVIRSSLRSVHVPQIAGRSVTIDLIQEMLLQLPLSHLSRISSVLRAFGEQSRAQLDFCALGMPLMLGVASWWKWRTSQAHLSPAESLNGFVKIIALRAEVG